eukprot:gene6509-7539_t
MGFRDAYASVKNIVMGYIKSLDNTYDLYLTGHSLGGSLATLATADLLSRPEEDISRINSINLITFGQPPIGDADFAKYMESQADRYTYRRYVNYKSVLEEDPITRLPFYSHPNSKIGLYCGDKCPSISFGLHSLDLYQASLSNPDYAVCRTNCLFEHNRAIIYKSASHLCHTSKNSKLIMDTQTAIDKYSVCLFESRKSYEAYSYSQASSCKGGETLVSLAQKPMHVEHILKGGDTYVVIENHNSLTASVGLTYKANFTFSASPPGSPSNVVVRTDAQDEADPKTGDTLYTWTIEWDSPESLGDTTTDSLTYNLYISPMGKNWKQFKTVLPTSQKKCARVVTDIPYNIYSVVITATNTVESHPSKIVFVPSELN